MLPNMRVSSGRSRSQQSAFNGLWHNEIVKENHLYDMQNMCGDIAPAIQPRMGRTLVRTIEKPNGLFVKDGLCWVDGTGFYYEGVKKGDVADSEKVFGRLGAYVIIYPDKKYYNTVTDTFGDLGATWTGSAEFTHYTYEATGNAAEVYEGNAIKTTGAAFPFEVGEAVFITGAKKSENNRSAMIREVLDDGKTLVFTNNLFLEDSAQNIKMERKIPDLDWLCENENRLWGCKGDEIFATALGNPFRWNNFDGTAMDSYGVSVGSDGDFTGAYSYGGYPIFFKEDAIHKMYGDKPSNFQAMASATSGLEKGSHKSLAVAGELLFYMTRTGIVSYSGGVPTPVSLALGNADFSNAVAGSDGRRYYVSVQENGSGWVLYVYDTWLGVWHKEDETHALGFAYSGGVLYMLDAKDNGLYKLRDRDSDEGFAWFVETGDFTDADPDRKAAGKLQVRMAIDAGAYVKIFVQYDSDGVWREIKMINGELKKQSVLVPIVPKRCDHFRLRFIGMGQATLYSITRENYHGTEYR